MIPLGSRSLFSWIWLTQFGDPLAHCQEGVLHSISSDRLAGLAGFAEAEPKDEEVGELVLLARDITEGWGLPEELAEVRPLDEELVARLDRLGGGGGVNKRHRSAEISCKAISGLRNC